MTRFGDISNCSYSDNHEVGVFRQRHVRDVSLGFKDPAGKPARNCPIAVVAVDTSTAEQGRGSEEIDRSTAKCSNAVVTMEDRSRR